MEFCIVFSSSKDHVHHKRGAVPSEHGGASDSKGSATSHGKARLWLAGRERVDGWGEGGGFVSFVALSRTLYTIREELYRQEHGGASYSKGSATSHGKARL